jgi:hypothetical protein
MPPNLSEGDSLDVWSAHSVFFGQAVKRSPGFARGSYLSNDDLCCFRHRVTLAAEVCSVCDPVVLVRFSVIPPKIV